MGNNRMGEVIRSLRKRAHMTQEELAEGICSSVSISRIENGNQMPSSAVLEALLARLGTSTYQICSISYQTDRQLAFEQEAGLVTELLNSGKLREAKEWLARLEKTAKSDPINWQYYLLLSATILLYKGNANTSENASQNGSSNPSIFEKTSQNSNSNPSISENTSHNGNANSNAVIPDNACQNGNVRISEILSTLHEALRITKPSFDFDDFRNELLSVREANILNSISVALYQANETRKAIHIGEELYASLKKHTSNVSGYDLLRINVAINLAQCMESEKRYEEELLYCQEAENFSIESLEQALLPEILYIKAKALHMLGNDAESRSILSAIIPYMELIHKTEFARLAKDFAREELGLGTPEI